MLDIFKPDYFWMLREAKGYFPWAEQHSYRLYRYLWNECHRCHDEPSVSDVIRQILINENKSNELIDIFFKAVVRAEIRFISRYIPQRSHEERLTGHLVSEIDNALCMVKNVFQSCAAAKYGQSKELDFLYYDLSRGGRIEKHTGADLGFILVMDLPDYPFLVKSIILQAKKINNSAQLVTKQHSTLIQHGQEKVAYLFYDTCLKTLASPMVLRLNDHDLNHKFEESQKKGSSSFSINFDEIMDGTPLSFFMIDDLMNISRGMRHSSFDEAFQYFISQVKTDDEIFQGILGIISLGRTIQFNADQEIGLRIKI